MVKFTIYLGLNDKDTKTQLEAYQITSHFVEGATFIDATGLWRGDLENTLVIEVLLNNDEYCHDLINKLCNRLKEAYNQECVMFTAQSLSMVNV